MSKKGVIAIIGLAGLGAILLATRAKAVPPVPEVPPPIEPPVPPPPLLTVEQILGAADVDELNEYYFLINQAFFTGQISINQYEELYDAYRTRYRELTEGY